MGPYADQQRRCDSDRQRHLRGRRIRVDASVGDGRAVSMFNLVVKLAMTIVIIPLVYTVRDPESFD